jgi:hypothetical protein
MQLSFFVFEVGRKLTILSINNSPRWLRGATRKRSIFIITLAATYIDITTTTGEEEPA